MSRLLTPLYRSLRQPFGGSAIRRSRYRRIDSLLLETTRVLCVSRTGIAFSLRQQKTRGGTGRIRTGDHLINSQALYLLSYRAINDRAFLNMSENSGYFTGGPKTSEGIWRSAEESNPSRVNVRTVFKTVFRPFRNHAPCFDFRWPFSHSNSACRVG